MIKYEGEHTMQKAQEGSFKEKDPEFPQKNALVGSFSKKKGISNKFKNLLVYFLSSLLIFVFLDFYVFKLFGHGFPSSISEEKFERSPSPYDSFSGKPFYEDHNSLGFRGIVLP